MHSKISSALKQQICAQYMLFVCLQTLAMQNKSKHNFASQSNMWNKSKLIALSCFCYFYFIIIVIIICISVLNVGCVIFLNAL